MEAIAAGARLALGVRWTGVLALPFGVVRPGDARVCESGIFLKFADEKIVEQHSCDCSEDFPAPGV